MKNILIFSLLIITGLAGSNVYAVEASGAKNSQSAQLVIFRTVTRASNSGINYRLNVDDKPVGKLKAKTIINLQLAPGKHVISTNDKKRSQLEVNLAAGTTTFINGSINNRVLEMTETTPTEKVLAEISADNTVARIH